MDASQGKSRSAVVLSSVGRPLRPTVLETTLELTLRTKDGGTSGWSLQSRGYVPYSSSDVMAGWYKVRLPELGNRGGSLKVISSQAGMYIYLV